jgi:hypothetical protein
VYSIYCIGVSFIEKDRLADGQRTGPDPVKDSKTSPSTRMSSPPEDLIHWS